MAVGSLPLQSGSEGPTFIFRTARRFRVFLTQALPELYVSVSTHTAPMVKTGYAGAPKAQAGWADDREPTSAKSMLDSGDCVASYIPTSPANQRLADIPIDGPERRRHEAPIVAEPSPKFGIDYPSQIFDGLPRTAMQLPSSDLIPDFLRRIRRDGPAPASRFEGAVPHQPYRCAKPNNPTAILRFAHDAIRKSA